LAGAALAHLHRPVDVVGGDPLGAGASHGDGVIGVADALHQHATGCCEAKAEDGHREDQGRCALEESPAG